jgi:thiosulfate reductase cytochrome b subunit
MVKRQVSNEVLDTKISSIQDDVREIKTRIDHNYVTKEEFDPIKKLVYGMVALILTAVVGALIALVIKQ